MKPFIFTGVVSAVLLAACGGGGGSSGITASTSISYQAVASEGELISYSVDTTALTYSYTIIESAYGKQGVSGRGNLIRNLDGTYTPSNFNGKIVVQDSGLLLGAIYEDLDGNNSNEVIPVMGIANPIASLADAADTYNFVSRQCASSCTNHYGTFELNADGTWRSCVGANLAYANPSCTASVSGDIGSFSSGRATIRVGGTVGGSLLIFKDSSTNQKAIFLDFNGRTVLGKGELFAGSQTLPVSADGNWYYKNTVGEMGVVRVASNSYTDTGTRPNFTNYSYSGTFTRDQPWSGFVTTDNGHIVLTASSGVYASYAPSGYYMAVGIKKN